MAIKVGDRVPSITLKTLVDGKLTDIGTDALFAGKTVAMFGVPGAFTRTCSAKHLPGFVQQADALRAKGVQSIVCVAVNDAFVMDAWGKQHGAPGRVTMIGDGNAEFARAIGLDKDSTANGMGVRSQRFALLVRDGRVASLAVDPPGEFGATSAEAVLAKL